jgi:hypothetical protein
MLLHLATLDDLNLDQPVAAFRMHAATDRVGAHRLTDSPAHADIILFTQCHMLLPDWRLQTIRRHRLTRQFREKVLVYNECDQPWCAFPGVYVNMPARRLVEAYQRPWGYFVPPPEAVDGPARPPVLLRRVRHRPLPAPAVRVAPSGRHRRGGAGVQVLGPDIGGVSGAPAAVPVHARALALRALPPRGNGTSSVRLYEAIAVGAVPVIIADDWVAPAGPVWEDFSIRWPEGRTEGLARMLEARDGDWPRLSAAARRAHEEYFSPAVYFHQVAQRCADLMRAGATSRFPARGVIDRQFADVAAGRLRARIRYAAGRAVDTARDRARARSQS